MIKFIQQVLRASPLWVEFRSMLKEGVKLRCERYLLQRVILKTKPIWTSESGVTEVHTMTWWRDWLDALWALKSFYYYAQVNYPLCIHDGGLMGWQIQIIQKHFPNAKIFRKTQTDKTSLNNLKDMRLMNCFHYRRSHVLAKKVFDPYFFSKTESYLWIDSDVLFFKRPSALIPESPNETRNKQIRDLDICYSCSLDELEKYLHFRPMAALNAGVMHIYKKSISLQRINEWLSFKKLWENLWFVEQTITAICSSLYGVEILPEEYVVDHRSNLPNDFICRHYPGICRALLYSEGFPKLIKNHFIEKLM